VRDQDVLVTDRYLGPGYGRPTPETQDAMLTAARLEGLLLDPVYTSKAFAHFLGLIRENALGNRSAAVFLHTGGTPALFAYGGTGITNNEY
jgi:1-aminocyclopropane-1-carboxylate deaminase/D-cysteine desulfhydrase-like pyridoxal-dependent ACC family enzyme